MDRAGALNVLVVLFFAVLGVNGRSLTVLWYELGDMRGLGGDPGFLYKYAFSYFVVGFWMTWLATLLALVSTAGMFPDFLSSGSVDLFLAKPISRIRLFFTKYLAGLLFVAFQVSLFTLLSFFVLGLRGGLWEAGLFWAIPIVMMFFSYLFAVCVLFGVITRSTIAALLLTLLAWFLFWGIDFADRTIDRFGQSIQTQHDLLSRRIETLDGQLARPARLLTPRHRRQCRNEHRAGRGTHQFDCSTRCHRESRCLDQCPTNHLRRQEPCAKDARYDCPTGSIPF